MVISPRHARGQPDRRPDAQAGKTWLAPPTTGPAVWYPHRDKITTSTGSVEGKDDAMVRPQVIVLMDVDHNRPKAPDRKPCVAGPRWTAEV